MLVVWNGVKVQAAGPASSVIKLAPVHCPKLKEVGFAQDELRESKADAAPQNISLGYAGLIGEALHLIVVRAIQPNRNGISLSCAHWYSTYNLVYNVGQEFSCISLYSYKNGVT